MRNKQRKSEGEIEQNTYSRLNQLSSNLRPLCNTHHDVGKDLCEEVYEHYDLYLVRLWMCQYNTRMRLRCAHLPLPASSYTRVSSSAQSSRTLATVPPRRREVTAKQALMKRVSRETQMRRRAVVWTTQKVIQHQLVRQWTRERTIDSSTAESDRRQRVTSSAAKHGCSVREGLRSEQRMQTTGARRRASPQERNGRRTRRERTAIARAANRVSGKVPATLRREGRIETLLEWKRFVSTPSSSKPSRRNVTGTNSFMDSISSGRS